MAGVTMSVHVDDIKLEQGLRDMIRAAGDLTPAMDEIGEMLVSSVVDRFARGEDPEGHAWAQSARVRAQGGVTLTDTGILKNSITHETSSDSVMVGSVLEYAAIHQFGGTIRPKNGAWLLFRVNGRWVMVHEVEMPARPFLGINDEDTARAVDILITHLEAGR